VPVAAYHPGYYGAFVLDPDGHNIEVVNHNPTAQPRLWLTTSMLCPSGSSTKAP